MNLPKSRSDLYRICKRFPPYPEWRSSSAAVFRDFLEQQFYKVQPGDVFKTLTEPSSSVVVMERLCDTMRVRVFNKDSDSDHKLDVFELDFLTLDKKLCKLADSPQLCNAVRQWLAEQKESHLEVKQDPPPQAMKLPKSRKELYRVCRRFPSFPVWRFSTATDFKRFIRQQFEKVRIGDVFETCVDPEDSKWSKPYVVIVMKILREAGQVRVFSRDYERGKQLDELVLDFVDLHRKMPRITKHSQMCKAARNWFIQQEKSLDNLLDELLGEDLKLEPPPPKIPREIIVSSRTETEAQNQFQSLLACKVNGEPLAAGFAYDLIVHFSSCYTINQIGGLLSKYLRMVLESTLSKFKHELKLQLKCIVQSREDGEHFTSIANFPAAGFQKVWVATDVQEFLNVVETRYRALESGDDMEFPDLFGNTKTFLQCIASVKFQVNKQYTAGCYQHDAVALGRGVLWNPANNDNLCLWRCLAKVLYEWKHKRIRKKNSPDQRQMAQYLLEKVRKQQPKLSPDGAVALNEIATVADALKLDLRVCTRTNIGAREMLFPQFDFDNPRSGHPGLADLVDAKCSPEPIYFHYEESDSGHGHFVLINKMNAYVTQFECEICKVKWSATQANSAQYKRYKQHMEKHRAGKDPNETELKFDPEKLVQPRLSAFEEHLGIPMRHNCYFAYDFEALTTKYNDDPKNQITSKHEPIAFVLKFINYFDTAPEFECGAEFCGEHPEVKFVEHLTDIHDKLKAYLTKQFWLSYGDRVNSLKDKLCSCTPRVHHRLTCKKKPGVVEPASRCGFVGCCKVRETHAKGWNSVAEDTSVVMDIMKEETKREVPFEVKSIIETYLPKNKKCAFQVALDALKRQFLNVPVYGFNSGRYDMTFVVKALGRTDHPKLSNVISKSAGFMKLDYGIYSFLDMWLLGTPDCSLEKAGKQWGVEVSKGYFPYSWFDNPAKLNYMGLPPREDWYNDMRRKELPEADYRELVSEFKQDGMETFKEYMMKYCRIDVEVLAQVADRYRAMVWEEYQLDLCSYLSVGQLSMQNWLTQRKRSGEDRQFPLPFIADQNCYRVVNKSIFGGRTEVFRQHLQTTPDSIGASLDESNLYGHSMQGRLLYGPMEYRNDRKECEEILQTLSETAKHQQQLPWHDRWSFQTLHWNDLCTYNTALDRNQPPEDPYGYDGLFEVRLSFTQRQQQQMKEFPPLGEHGNPPKQEATKFMKDKRARQDAIIKEKTGRQPHRPHKVSKLMYTLCDKEDYSIDGFALKY